MSSNNSNQNNGGIGFVGLLTIVFITLKLTGYLDWSWWWVWSPAWITLCAIGFIVAVIILAAVIETYKKNKRIRRY